MEITIKKGWGENAQTFKGALTNRQKTWPGAGAIWY